MSHYKKLLVLLLVPTLQSYAGGCATIADVQRADRAWANAMATHNPEAVDRLYSSRAILLATYKARLLKTSAKRQKYFANLFSELKNLKVTFNKEYCQVFPGGAASLGIYTFSGIKGNQPTEIPARYTFVYQSTKNGCKLLVHHSSVVPKI